MGNIGQSQKALWYIICKYCSDQKMKEKVNKISGIKSSETPGDFNQAIPSYFWLYLILVISFKPIGHQSIWLWLYNLEINFVKTKVSYVICFSLNWGNLENIILYLSSSIKNHSQNKLWMKLQESDDQCVQYTGSENEYHEKSVFDEHLLYCYENYKRYIVIWFKVLLIQRNPDHLENSESLSHILYIWNENSSQSYSLYTIYSRP